MITSPLSDALLENARRYPQAVATMYGERCVTYLEHFNAAQHIASALARLGVRHQDRVAILAKNSIEYIDIFGAAQRAGFIAATVNFRLAPAEIEYILRDSEPVVLFFEDEYASTVETLRASMSGIRAFICIGAAPSWAIPYGDFVRSGSIDGANFQAKPNDVLHLIYTSGTTGRPKGVMRSHSAESQMVKIMTNDVGVLRSEVVQIIMPLFHVGARWLQLATHVRSARLLMHREFDELEVIRAIQDHKVTITHMAPTIVQRVLEHPDAELSDLSSLRTVYYSAAPMPLPVLRRGLGRLGQVFVQLYGMTEGGGTVLHKDQHLLDGSTAQTKRLASVGQPSQGVKIRIIDDLGADLPQGQIGEVATRTSTHMKGYWSNSAATIDALRGGWYRTGDVGYLDEEDFLFLVDRKKDMIISGGENIYCREVEDAIGSHHAVDEVAVIGIPDPQWGESVRAIVVLREGVSCSQDEIINHCRSQLASYKKPRSVVFVAELPKLNTGKVDKKLLRATHSSNMLGRGDLR